MTWRQKTAAKVKKLGGRIEDDTFGISFDYQIIAPDGYYWAGAGLHACVISYYKSADKEDNKLWAEENWKDAYNRIDGIEKCIEDDCEWCNPEAEEAA